MRSSLLAAAAELGVLTRSEALRLAPEHVLNDTLRARALIRQLPGVYVLPDRADDTHLTAPLDAAPCAAPPCRCIGDAVSTPRR